MRWVTNTVRPNSICLACGAALAPALERFASLRCHDCRDAGAAIRQELLPHANATPAPRIRLQAA